MEANHDSPDTQLRDVLKGIKEILEAQRPTDEHFILNLAKQLGTLSTAGVVIALCGKLVGASDEKIAALTLSVVSALYIVIYRQSIQQRLQSYVLLIAGIAIIALAILFRDSLLSALLGRTISQATGIIEFHSKANDFLPRVPKLIENTQEEIWFTGISFYVSLPAIKSFLLKKLEDGVTVRFLIYNPLSGNIDDVASGFGQTKEELMSECDVTIQNLRTLFLQAKERNAKGSLEVRLFSSIPKMRIYIFDRRREDGFTYFIPHVDQQNSPNVPGFLVKNIRTGIVPAFLEGIERVWSKAQPFDTFLNDYEKRPLQALSQTGK